MPLCVIALKFYTKRLHVTLFSVVNQFTMHVLKKSCSICVSGEARHSITTIVSAADDIGWQQNNERYFVTYCFIYFFIADFSLYITHFMWYWSRDPSQLEWEKWLLLSRWSVKCVL